MIKRKNCQFATRNMEAEPLLSDIMMVVLFVAGESCFEQNVFLRTLVVVLSFGDYFVIESLRGF